MEDAEPQFPSQQFCDSSAGTTLYLFSCLLPPNTVSSRADPQRFDGILSWLILSTITPPTQEPTSAEASRDLYYLKCVNALNYGKILLDDDEWPTDASHPPQGLTIIKYTIKITKEVSCSGGVVKQCYIFLKSQKDLTSVCIYMISHTSCIIIYFCPFASNSPRQ